MEPVQPSHMEIAPLTDIRAWMVVALLVGLLVCLVAYLTRYRGRERCEKCWLPEIEPGVWDREEYRCMDCGTRYRVQTDLSLPRGRHRWWAAR